MSLNSNLLRVRILMPVLLISHFKQLQVATRLWLPFLARSATGGESVHVCMQPVWLLLTYFGPNAYAANAPPHSPPM